MVRLALVHQPYRLEEDPLVHLVLVRLVHLEEDPLVRLALVLPYHLEEARLHLEGVRLDPYHLEEAYRSLVLVPMHPA